MTGGIYTRVQVGGRTHTTYLSKEHLILRASLTRYEIVNEITVEAKKRTLKYHGGNNCRNGREKTNIRKSLREEH